MPIKCLTTFILLIGAATLVTLDVLDLLLINGEKVVAQNSSSQVEMVSRNSNNNSETYVGKSNITANSEVLSIVEQHTEMSSPAPVRHPGQPLHEVVSALPLLDTGKVSGKLTFTADKPIEVEVLHPYEPKDEVDTMHGEPYHAVLLEQKYCHFSAEKFG